MCFAKRICRVLRDWEDRRNASKNCFCCVPWTLICCIFTHFSVIFHVSRDFFLTYRLFWWVLFCFPVIGDFSALEIFLLFWVDLVVVGEHTLCDFNSFNFVEVCFMANIIGYGLSWYVIHGYIRSMCILLSWCGIFCSRLLVPIGWWRYRVLL